MTVEIPLTQGQVALVSEEDADYLNQFKWSANLYHRYADGGKFLAVRNTTQVKGKKGTELMHRVVLSRMLDRRLLRTEQVDHINGNPLDNSRPNLRLATNSQNCMNKERYSTNTSGYKGVCWHKASGKWMARIVVSYKEIYIGLFKTPEEAFAAYCEAAKKYHREFARFE